MDFWKDDPDAVPVDELRRRARQHCKCRSQRTVAAEIGVGRTTLNKFVAGDTNPHPRVRHLLQEWYRKHAGADARAATAALAVLLEGLPADVQEAARGRLVDGVAWAHGEAGQEVPAWVTIARDGEGRGCPDPAGRRMTGVCESDVRGKTGESPGGIGLLREDAS